MSEERRVREHRDKEDGNWARWRGEREKGVREAEIKGGKGRKRGGKEERKQETRERKRETERQSDGNTSLNCSVTERTDPPP